MRMTTTEKTTSNYYMMNLFFFVHSSNQHRSVWNRALQTGNRNRCIPVIYLCVFLSLARPSARMEFISFCKYYRCRVRRQSIQNASAVYRSRWPKSCSMLNARRSLISYNRIAPTEHIIPIQIVCDFIFNTFRLWIWRYCMAYYYLCKLCM